MNESDKVFAGSVPAVYDRLLGPLLFRPYALEMARRAAALAPSRVLETAAGTGIVTEQLLAALPQDTSLTATDLNQAMLDVAAGKFSAPNLTRRACDAMQLPFGDGSFDLVVCQFGVMFFPDKAVAYGEAHRVLRQRGGFLFNVWQTLDENALPRVISEAVAAALPHDPPSFFARTPHGYHDVKAISNTLRAAGFREIGAETIELRSRAASAKEIGIGFCQGTPLRNEIEKREPGGLDRITDLAIAAVTKRFGAGPIDVPMQATIISATA